MADGNDAPGYSLPSADQLFAQPQSGAAHDAIWSNLQSSGARILNAVGYGFKDAWGAEPMGLSDETARSLSQAGVINDYRTSHQDFLKSFNEAALRTAANVRDVALRTPGAVIGALHAGAEQTTYELQGDESQYATFKDLRHIAAAPAAVATGLLEAMQEGALPEVPEGAVVARHVEANAAARLAETSDAERLAQASRARAVGAVGEGEAGFYGAEPITAENQAARVEAAQDAGLTAPPPPEPPPPDVHALARRIDPDTFDRYDALAEERQAARDELDRLGDLNREERPEVIEARRHLNELIGLEPEAHARAGAFEERLHAMAASAPDELLEKVATAYDRLDALLTEDTPELAEARSRLAAADLAMRDMAPDVATAYRAASEMAPTLPAEAETAAERRPGEAGEKAEPAGSEGGEQPTQAARAPEEQAGAEAATEARIAPVAASPEAAAEVAPGSPTGEQKLGDVGSEQAAQAEAQAEGKATRKAGGTGFGNLKAVEGTGETATRSLAQSVASKAIEDGLTSAFGDLPEYQRVSMSEQATQAAALMDKDYAAAKAIAMGEKAPPKGLLPESMFVAVEKRALEEGDVETLRQLATRSRLSTPATTMGQRIRALGERDPSSPVGAIQEVQRAREAAIGKGRDLEAEKRATVQEIKAEVRKAASTGKTEAWADFLAAIKCGE